MKIEQFLEELEFYVGNWQKKTSVITYTVSKAKGVVTVIAAHHFPNSFSCEEVYGKTKDDFDEVVFNFKTLESRYNYLYIKTNLMTEKMAKHYDSVYNAGLNEQTKKVWRTDENTMVSSISFKYPQKN